MIDPVWCNERIEAAKTRIEILETAQAELSVGKIQSFTLDTGQSRQVVVKKSIGVMETAIELEYNRLSVLDMRCNGGQASIARPAF